MILRFSAYRRYSDARVEMNDAVMALLIGARLGEHALSTSAAAPDALLPSLFGQIPGIARLNRTAGDAARLLADAEKHLAYMAIPYVLTIHGTYLVSAAEMIREAGRDDAGGDFEVAQVEDLTKLSLETGHEYLFERCGKEPPTPLVPLFHIVRRIRNRIVHFGGAAGSRLLADYRALPAGARAYWEDLADRALPDAVTAGHLELAEGEVVAALAVSRHLAHAVNDLLGHQLGREYWAEEAVRDYKESNPQRFGEQTRRLRRIRGHADRLYGPLSLTDEELALAIRKLAGERRGS